MRSTSACCAPESSAASTSVRSSRTWPSGRMCRRGSVTDRRPPLGWAVRSAGMVRCWHCRHVLAANWSLSKRHGKRRAYRCRNERCGRWTFALEDDLLPLAEEAFFARVEDIEKQQMATDGKVIRKLEKERQEIQQGISNLVQLATRRSSRLEAIDEQLTTEEQRLERVERRLASAGQPTGAAEADAAYARVARDAGGGAQAAVPARVRRHRGAGSREAPRPLGAAAGADRVPAAGGGRQPAAPWPPPKGRAAAAHHSPRWRMGSSGS